LVGWAKRSVPTALLEGGHGALEKEQPPASLPTTAFIHAT
jgi:hypothetical protein